MANNGEFGNPDQVDSLWVPKLEYPGGSGTIFLFSGGIWVGALKDGVPRVSTATTGNDGTNEFAGLEFATPNDQNNATFRTIGWLECLRGSSTESERQTAVIEGRYLGQGIWTRDDDNDWDSVDDVDHNGAPSPDFDGIPFKDDDGDGMLDEEILNGRDDDGDGYVDEDVGSIDEDWVIANASHLRYLNDDPSRISPGDANGDGDATYDPESGIDEDPAGDMARDYQDNDCDDLMDADDPDYDGDLVPGDIDDDGDGLADEDGSARAEQELSTVYVDTCLSCLDSETAAEHEPLGLRIAQHSSQWCHDEADDFIFVEYQITNISESPLPDLCVAVFYDFCIKHGTYYSYYGCVDDVTFYLDELQMAVMGDDDMDDGLLAARYVGVRVIERPAPDVTVSYKITGQLVGPPDPRDDAAKYALMSAGDRDPDALTPSDWRVMLCFGPLGDLPPGGSIAFTVALVNGVERQDLIDHSEASLAIYNAGFLCGRVPNAPYLSVYPLSDGAIVRWRSNAEWSFEPILDREDFQGYHTWRTQDGEAWTLVATYDLPDTIGLNAAWPPPVSDESGYDYEIRDSGLPVGAPFSYAVTAFDDGDNGDGIHSVEWDNRNCSIGVLESPRYADPALTIHTATSPRADGDVDSVYVVPNPYVGSSKLLGAPWTYDPEVYARNRHVEFRNLPGTCTIRIFTLAGDLVQTIKHTNGESWEPWDLRGREGDEVAAGIFLYHVSSAGNEHIGKFVVVR